MEPIHIGLVADPSFPSHVARSIRDLEPPGTEDSGSWQVEVLSEPFTTGFEDVDTAVAQLKDRASERDWDVVVGLTELPLRDDTGCYLLVETDQEKRTAVLSLPASVEVL